MTWLTTLATLDFWQWAALTGLGLTAIGVGLGVVALRQAGRQTQALTGQLGATAQLIAGAEQRTQTTLAQMDAGLKQVLDRIDARAEGRYRDLRDRLDGDTEATP
jgi:hypothetical protein